MCSILRKDYFKQIDTREKAYWLGFIWADGCISSDYKNIILDLVDGEHVVKFCNAIESDNKLYIHGNKGQYTRVSVGCKEMALQINDYGCTPSKSLTIEYPNTNIFLGDFEKDFVRGYFDGNGCLCFSSTMQKRSDLNSSKLYKREHWLFSIVGTKSMMNGIKNFLPVDTAIKQISSNGISRIKCGGNQKIKIIMKSFYDNATIYLNRKYNKYLDLMKY